MIDICLHCGSDVGPSRVTPEGAFCDHVCRGYYLTMLESEKPTFESDSLALARAVMSMARKARISDLTKADLLRLEDLADTVIAWEESEDPYAMGWIDDRGRP